MSTQVMVIIIVAIAVGGIIRLARIVNGTEHLGRRHRHGGHPLLDPAQPSNGSPQMAASHTRWPPRSKACASAEPRRPNPRENPPWIAPP
jgi:hypothetical protein